MTAKICYKLGKYLENPLYTESLFTVMDSISEINIIDLTILFIDNLGVEKKGLTPDDAKMEIEKWNKDVDNMNDNIKVYLREKYLESIPSTNIQ